MLDQTEIPSHIKALLENVWRYNIFRTMNNCCTKKCFWLQWSQGGICRWEIAVTVLYCHKSLQDNARFPCTECVVHLRWLPWSLPLSASHTLAQRWGCGHSESSLWTFHQPFQGCSRKPLDPPEATCTSSMVICLILQTDTLISGNVTGK